MHGRHLPGACAHDGVANGDETGTDCGGPTAPSRCTTGQGCANDTDCDNVLCNLGTKVCSPPAPNDLLQSDGESWMDLYGNLAEYTGNFTASTNDFCDFSVANYDAACPCTRSARAGTGTRYTNIPISGIIGRTWEGHNYGTGSIAAFQVTFQYGKFGGRCVRPASKY